MPRIVPSEVVRIIDRYFAFAAKPEGPTTALGAADADRISTVVTLIDQIPDDLIKLPPADYTDFVASLGMLRANALILIGRGHGHTFSGTPMWVLRHGLAKCPDSAATAAGHELKFVRPTALRDDLRRDLSEANDALREGRWKAATILSGAVIEALLVWRLSKLTVTARQAAITAVSWAKPSHKPNGAPVDWKLFQLIEVAAAVPVISDDTKTQVSLARNYRNLIHPGRTLKTGERCGKDTALGALSGVERVIRELGTK